MKAGSSVIHKCKCYSDFQDERYGYGMRVHNVGKRQGSLRIIRCTVCLDIKEIQDDDEKRSSGTKMSGGAK